MIRRNILYCLTAVILLQAVLFVFPSCADNKQTPGTIETTAAAVSATEKVPDITDYLPETDFEGYTFTVAARENNTYWPTLDVWAEAENGEPVNDAVFRRNSKIEEIYNLDIVMLENSDR